MANKTVGATSRCMRSILTCVRSYSSSIQSTSNSVPSPFHAQSCTIYEPPFTDFTQNRREKMVRIPRQSCKLILYESLFAGIISGSYLKNKTKEPTLSTMIPTPSSAAAADTKVLQQFFLFFWIGRQKI